MKIRAISLSLFLLIASSASAVKFDIGLDAVYSSDSTTLVPTSTLALVVVDKNGDGFSSVLPNASLLLGALINGSDDFVAWRGTFAGSGTAGVFSDSAIFNIGTSTVPNGAAFAILWFPSLTSSSTSAITGASYGLYTSTAVQFGSSSAWNVGSNNAATYALNVYTSANTGNLAPSNPLVGGVSKSLLTANLSVIPEPSSWAAMFGVLAMGFAFWKRSRK